MMAVLDLFDDGLPRSFLVRRTPKISLMRFAVRRQSPISQPPSRPGELHPEPLTDPCLSLSTHTARATH